MKESADSTHVAISFHVGLFTNESGGAVIKWVFADGRQKSMVLPSVLAVEFARSIDRSIHEGQFPDWRPKGTGPTDTDRDPIAQFLKHQPDVHLADFDSQHGRRSVSSWNWQVYSNGVVLVLLFGDGHHEAVSFHGSLCYYLRDYFASLRLPLNN